MYIQLDVGWMNHPFPTSSFRIASAEQIATLRALNIGHIRYIPSKSDPQLAGGMLRGDGGRGEGGEAPKDEEPVAAAAIQPELEAQNQQLAFCDRRFGEITRGYQQVAEVVDIQPQAAHEISRTLVDTCVDDLLASGDSVIRLLSEDVGVRSALHSANVMVLSLLLGKALGLQCAALKNLGLAALLHDLGKLALPHQVAEPYAHLTAFEMERYESHVGETVARAERMKLPVAVVTAIAQHHERVDGTGFPLRLLGEDLGPWGQVVGLVNQYDRLCNPTHGEGALTPHEALSTLFAQYRTKFDTAVLGAFIRMMGVYPPGSIVQLVNDCFAIVVSVNTARPLRPRVVLHDPATPKVQALIVDLETRPELGIRRSLRPVQLPRDALDYLSPRERVCYFFERAVDLGAAQGAAA
jgi:putative nucleotidyltransferase with HDIG domain